MKKLLPIFMIVFLLTSCSSSKDSILEKNGYSFSEIVSIKISDGNQDGIEIDKDDFKIINEYTIEEEINKDTSKDLNVYPGTTHIKITLKNKDVFTIYALRNGEFVVCLDSDIEKPIKIYKSTNEMASYDLYFYELYWKDLFK